MIILLTYHTFTLIKSIMKAKLELMQNTYCHFLRKLNRGKYIKAHVGNPALIIVPNIPLSFNDVTSSVKSKQE